MDDCVKILIELSHLALDVVLAIATVCLAIYTYRLVTATQRLFIETKAAAEKQLGVNTWLEFVRRFDSKQMDDARHELATEISQQLPTIGEEVLEFFEELGIAWNEDCIDKKLAHSSFSYDAQNWWALVKKPYVDKLRTDKGEEFYCEYEKMLTSMRKHFPNDPEVTPEMAAVYLKTELGGGGILDSLG
jgi:hypothetical protein